MKLRRPGWLRWILWTLVGLALFSFAALVILDIRITSDIDHEVQALLKQGIDVRRITPERDAGKGYQRIAPELEKEWMEAFHDGKIPAASFDKLTELAQRPFATYPQSDGRDPKAELDRMNYAGYLDQWMLFAMDTAVGRQDLKSFEQLSDLYHRQCLQMAGTEQAFLYMIVARMATCVDGKSSQPIRDCVRKHLETFADHRLLVARLSKVGRRARFGNPPRAFPPPPPKSWLDNLVESHVLFKKAVDLAVLRKFRKVADQALKQTSNQALITNHSVLLKRLLSVDKSRPAQRAEERIDVSPEDNQFLEVRNEALIRLDLIESHLKGKPLVPTWSKPYCFNPGLGVRITVSKVGSRVYLINAVSGGPLKL